MYTVASYNVGHFSLPAVGEVLATYEDDARSFLFPEPKLVPSFSGEDREVLMTRDPSFPVGYTIARIFLLKFKN